MYTASRTASSKGPNAKKRGPPPTARCSKMRGNIACRTTRKITSTHHVKTEAESGGNTGHEEAVGHCGEILPTSGHSRVPRTMTLGFNCSTPSYATSTRATCKIMRRPSRSTPRLRSSPCGTWCHACTRLEEVLHAGPEHKGMGEGRYRPLQPEPTLGSERGEGGSGSSPGRP